MIFYYKYRWYRLFFQICRVGFMFREDNLTVSIPLSGNGVEQTHFCKDLKDCMI